MLGVREVRSAMIVHLLEAQPYNDPVESYFLDLSKIDENSPRELQRYKEILENLVRHTDEKEVEVHGRYTLMDGYTHNADELEFGVGFYLLDCVVKPPCHVEASIHVHIYSCECPCHEDMNKKGMHIASCAGKDRPIKCG